MDIAGSLTMEEAIAGIGQLRALHVELDYTVLEAYGWANREWRTANRGDVRGSSPGHSPLAAHHSPEIALGHDFHEVETLPENDRTRYTVSPAARRELLKRLLQLNHARAAEERAATQPKGSRSRGRRPQRGKGEDEIL